MAPSAGMLAALVVVVAAVVGTVQGQGEPWGEGTDIIFLRGACIIIIYYARFITVSP